LHSGSEISVEIFDGQLQTGVQKGMKGEAIVSFTYLPFCIV